jgi:hypothetical protein
MNFIILCAGFEAIAVIYFISILAIAKRNTRIAAMPPSPATSAS